jgi:hypothetical protein
MSTAAARAATFPVLEEFAPNLIKAPSEKHHDVVRSIRAWQCRVTGAAQFIQIVMAAAEETAYILDADEHLLSVVIGAL